MRVYYKNGMAWIASQPYAPRVQRNVVWSMRGKTHMIPTEVQPTDA